MRGPRVGNLLKAALRAARITAQPVQVRWEYSCVAAASLHDRIWMNDTHQWLRAGEPYWIASEYLVKRQGWSLLNFGAEERVRQRHDNLTTPQSARLRCAEWMAQRAGDEVAQRAGTNSLRAAAEQNWRYSASPEELARVAEVSARARKLIGVGK